MTDHTTDRPGPAGRPGDLSTAAWVDLLGRIRLAALPDPARQNLDALTIKAVALRLACDAHPDGSHVYPHAGRLAVELEIEYDDAEAAVQVLVALGLLRPHGHRDGAFCHQLAAPTDLTGDSPLPIWSPAEVLAAAGR